MKRALCMAEVLLARAGFYAHNVYFKDGALHFQVACQRERQPFLIVGQVIASTGAELEKQITCIVAADAERRLGGAA